MLIIVVTKLIAPKIEETPSKCREKNSKIYIYFRVSKNSK